YADLSSTKLARFGRVVTFIQRDGGARYVIRCLSTHGKFRLLFCCKRSSTRSQYVPFAGVAPNSKTGARPVPFKVRGTASCFHNVVGGMEHVSENSLRAGRGGGSRGWADADRKRVG